MSEEKNQQQEVSIGFTHSGGRLEIEFADGVRVIPETVVVILGGMENLEKIAPALVAKTFDEFMAGIGVVKMKQDLNAYQQRIVSNHLNRFF